MVTEWLIECRASSPAVSPVRLATLNDALVFVVFGGCILSAPCVQQPSGNSDTPLDGCLWRIHTQSDSTVCVCVVSLRGQSEARWIGGITLTTERKVEKV